MNDRARFSHNIKHWLSLSDERTQKKLAKDSGVAERTIGYIVRNEADRKPDLLRLSKIAKAMKLPLWVLFLPPEQFDMGADGSLDELFKNYLACDAVRRKKILEDAKDQAELTARSSEYPL